MNESKKLSKEAKVGIIIAVLAVVFFTTILLVRNFGQVAETPGDYSNQLSSSLPTTTTPPPSTTTTAVTSQGEVGGIEDEVLTKPFLVEAEIYRPFFDPENNTQADNLRAIISYNGATITNTGVDYRYQDEAFTVYPAFSGSVIRVSHDDPDFGTIVHVLSADGLVANYQSLGSTELKVGDTVEKNRTIIGTAGESAFGLDGGKMLHFSVYRINPETALPVYYNPELIYEQRVVDIA